MRVKNTNNPDDVRIVCTKCMCNAEKFEVRRSTLGAVSGVATMFGVRCHGVERLVMFPGTYVIVDEADPVVMWSTLRDLYDDPYAEMERFERQMVECAEMVELLRRIAPYYPPKTPAPAPPPLAPPNNPVMPGGMRFNIAGGGVLGNTTTHVLTQINPYAPCAGCGYTVEHAMGCPAAHPPF